MVGTIVRAAVVLLVICLVAAVRPAPRTDTRDDASRIEAGKARIDVAGRRAPEARDARALRDGRALRDARLDSAVPVEPQPFTFHRHATLAEQSADPRGFTIAFSVARSARGPPG